MGLIDKIHKLFKTNTHKLSVVLSQDIDEKVDFIEINQDADDAVIEDHFDSRFIYQLQDVRDSILEDKNPKKALQLMRKAKISMAEIEKFFDKELFIGGSKYHKVQLKEVLLYCNDTKKAKPSFIDLPVNIIIMGRLLELGLTEYINKSIVSLYESDDIKIASIVSNINRGNFSDIPKEWHPVLKYSDELYTIGSKVIQKYETMARELTMLLKQYFNDAIKKYYTE
jgi:hypothetical protein